MHHFHQLNQGKSSWHTYLECGYVQLTD